MKRHPAKKNQSIHFFFTRLSIFLCVIYILVTDRDILCGLAVVLQDDGDVHVDDDQEGDDEVGHEKGDGHRRVAAVPGVTSLLVR